MPGSSWEGCRTWGDSISCGALLGACQGIGRGARWYIAVHWAFRPKSRRLLSGPKHLGRAGGQWSPCEDQACKERCQNSADHNAEGDEKPTPRRRSPAKKAEDGEAPAKKPRAPRKAPAKKPAKADDKAAKTDSKADKAAKPADKSQPAKSDAKPDAKPAEAGKGPADKSQPAKSSSVPGSAPGKPQAPAAKKSGGGRGALVFLVLIVLIGAGGYAVRDVWMPYAEPYIAKLTGGAKTEEPAKPQAPDPVQQLSARLAALEQKMAAEGGDVVHPGGGRLIRVRAR